MSEEFALQQSTRNSCTVSGPRNGSYSEGWPHESLVQSLLTGTRFALDQDGGVHRRNHLYVLEQSPEFVTGPNQIQSHDFSPCQNDWRSFLSLIVPLIPNAIAPDRSRLGPSMVGYANTYLVGWFSYAGPIDIKAHSPERACTHHKDGLSQS